MTDPRSLQLKATQEYKRGCFSCGHEIVYELNPPPEITEVTCSSCWKFQGTVLWAEMDPDVWIPMPDMKDAPLPEHQREFYTKQRIPDKLRWEIWERDNFTCQHCESRRMLTIDHIRSEWKGGTLDKENLQTLCRSCNSKKGIK